ncbi:hypothetical protein [Kordiimonas gwangyangensis]|uniref:hypothetical protein n=1 Tax=Kordiimonas gwangyangensis TaxID=288022 RepID=UPI00036B18DB|nr:hypothetical protein [Kordiimonas gwangyangensis]
MSQDTGSVEPQGGSGKILLVLGLLGGLAVGGGLGYYYSKSSAEGQGAPKEEVKVAPKGPLIDIDFERIAVPIYAKTDNGQRFLGNYFIDIAVQVRGEKNQIAIKRAETQLQHAFVSAISRNDLMREDSPLELDVDKVGNLLKGKANEVLGGKIVEAVLVKNAMRLNR